MKKTFADHIIAFNDSNGPWPALPKEIRFMNPFEDANTRDVSVQFYKKYYNDKQPRRMILGINPGRFGAGATGIPFTDSKRLEDVFGIEWTGKPTHEPSSVFIHHVIESYGGAAKFFGDFYITSVLPLGLVKANSKGEVNYNYYDERTLAESLRPFIVNKLRQQIAFGFVTDVCYCLGTGKNSAYLMELNKEFALFGDIVPLEHPRYIMQYRSKRIPEYIEKYLLAFHSESDQLRRPEV